MIHSVLRTLGLLVTLLVFTLASVRDPSDMFVPSSELLALMRSDSRSSTTPARDTRSPCLAVRVFNGYVLTQAYCVAQLDTDSP